MKIDREMMEYEGDLWLVLDAEGMAKELLFSKPTLREMQKAVGGLIEYAPVKKGATMPIPCGSNMSRVSQVKEVIVDEEGLLKGYGENAVSSYAMHNVPINEADKFTPVLVGPAIIHVTMSADDKKITFEEFMSLVSGSEPNTIFFEAFGIMHYHKQKVSA